MISWTVAQQEVHIQLKCGEYLAKNPPKSMLLKSFYPLEFDAAILDDFPLSKSFADLKNTVCLCVARCGARPRLPVAQFWLLRPGNKFQVKYGVHEAQRARTVKTTSQGSHQNRNIVEKKRKMDVQPNNRPSSLLGNTIHFR